ncbi:MAG TPA: hypothetical protein VFM79_11290 [Pelobium sp.]|nr:hypothetical protein [Pelobium sp.]
MANVFVLLILSVKVYGQVEANPSISELEKKMMKSQLANGQSLLYNGFNFYGYAPNYFENDHAFFLEESWTSGDVTYENITYHQVPLKYDLLKDELIVQYFDKLSSINLIKNKIQGFSISGHKFIRLDETDTNSEIPSGFYEELYHHKLVLLAKRGKTVRENVSANGVKRNIETLNRYYIYKNEKFQRFNSLSSLVKILKDRKKELSQYMKINKKKFKKEPEDAMVAIVTYYDQLQ